MTLDQTEQFQLGEEEMRLRMQMLRFKVHEKKIEEIWTALLDRGFERILLIKGWAAAQYYPQTYEREFSDLDIAVDPMEFEAVKKFLEAESPSYNIDLHRGLRRHDTLSFDEIFAASEKRLCGAAEITVPRIEDHLRILSVHWLTDGGAYRDRLRDIYYGIGNRPANFDWDRFLNSVSPTRRRWIVCTIGLTHKFLGLRIEDTPVAVEASKIPRWLLRAVEKEWKSKIRLKPLIGVRYKNDSNRQFGIRLLAKADNRREFLEQVQKRLMPNPIYATVEAEGEFDNRPRVFYMLKSFFRRLRKFGRMKDE